MLWQKATSLSCYNISSCGENPFSWDTGPWNTKVAFCLKRQKWVLSLMHTPPLKWIFWERYRCNLPVFGNFFLCPVCSTCVDSGSCSHWCIGCPMQIHKRTGFFWSLWWGGGHHHQGIFASVQVHWLHHQQYQILAADSYKQRKCKLLKLNLLLFITTIHNI